MPRIPRPNLPPKIDTFLESQFAFMPPSESIASRPGQLGHASGYILEGKELEVGYYRNFGSSPTLDIYLRKLRTT
jgi:hypothetical protein